MASACSAGCTGFDEGKELVVISVLKVKRPLRRLRLLASKRLDLTHMPNRPWARRAIDAVKEV
jgi:hypothetical protein